jgi:hypothetical protein
MMILRKWFRKAKDIVKPRRTYVPAGSGLRIPPELFGQFIVRRFRLDGQQELPGI